jgi:hypothetical protein
LRARVPPTHRSRAEWRQTRRGDRPCQGGGAACRAPPPAAACQPFEAARDRPVHALPFEERPVSLQACRSIASAIGIAKRGKHLSCAKRQFFWRHTADDAAEYGDAIRGEQEKDNRDNRCARQRQCRGRSHGFVRSRRRDVSPAASAACNGSPPGRLAARGESPTVGRARREAGRRTVTPCDDAPET